LNKKYIVITAAILGITILLVLVSDLGLMSAIPTSHAQVPKGKVFVMYAASLIRTFEETLGPTFQERTGYIYDGEPRGSIQIANMITDELRKPDIFVSAGTYSNKKIDE
jgi:ABC-type molybdate transport system substrate-binding protein